MERHQTEGPQQIHLGILRGCVTEDQNNRVLRGDGTRVAQDTSGHRQGLQATKELSRAEGRPQLSVLPVPRRSGWDRPVSEEVHLSGGRQLEGWAASLR